MSYGYFYLDGTLQLKHKNPQNILVVDYQIFDKNFKYETFQSAAIVIKIHIEVKSCGVYIYIEVSLLLYATYPRLQVVTQPIAQN